MPITEADVSELLRGEGPLAAMVARAYARRLGLKGGRSQSEAKRAAARRNLERANAVSRQREAEAAARSAASAAPPSDPRP